MLLSKQVRTVSLKPHEGRISGSRLPDLPLRHFQDQLLSVLCHCHVPDPAISTVAGKLQQPLTSSQTAVCPPFLPPALDGHTSSVMSDDPGVRAAVHAVARATLPHQPLLTSLPPLTPCSPPHPKFRLHQPCFPQTSLAPPQGHSPCFVVCLYCFAPPPGSTPSHQSFTPQHEALDLSPTLDPHKCWPNTLFFLSAAPASLHNGCSAKCSYPPHIS